MTESTATNILLRFKFVGFDNVERVKFGSVFDLAEARLQANWKLADDAMDAEFYLLKGQLRDQMDKDELLKSLPRSRCIFCSQTKTGEKNELLVSSDFIPSMRSLTELFNLLSATWASPINQNWTPAIEKNLVDKQSKTKESTEVLEQISKNELDTDTEFYDPETGFIRFLLSTEKLIYCFDLENTAEKGALYIDLAERTFYSKNSLEQLKPFFSDLKSQFSHNTLSPTKLQQQVAKDELKPSPLGNLIWYVSFSCSLGRAFKGYDKNTIVHLKRWPDANLPGCRELLKLAAFMHNNSVDLSTVQKKTKIPIEQIYNFYNACKAIDLIEHVQQTSVLEREIDDDKRQMIAKISRRLKQSL